MDITSVIGPGHTVKRNGSLNSKLADFLGNNGDALSAVKLDPAVLEAQITVDKNVDVEDEVSSRKSVENMNSIRDMQKQKFKSMVLEQQAALLSLTPNQLELLMKFTETLRQQRKTLQKQLECSFCKNNGKSETWYSSHCLKDGRGRVKCPVLRDYRCPQCGASGDWAHTIKYCPENVFRNTDSWNHTIGK
ncbi:hypothetical protein ACJJTC_001751 [Scirpophaga incertulas]